MRPAAVYPGTAPRPCNRAVSTVLMPLPGPSRPMWADAAGPSRGRGKGGPVQAVTDSAVRDDHDLGVVDATAGSESTAVVAVMVTTASIDPKNGRSPHVRPSDRRQRGHRERQQ